MNPQFGEEKVTSPVTGFVEVTLAVSVRPAFWANFVAGTVSTVVVVTGGLLPLAPPPQPRMKLSTHTEENPSATRKYRSPEGETSKSKATIPVRRLSAHHNPEAGGRIATGPKTLAWCAIALGLLEGATSETVSVAVAAAPLLNVTDDGEIEQVAPGMITPPQLRATVLERFDIGVIVIVDVPD